MSELLKSAIADAKAVRETALLNAKMALEEAFTPQLQSMLSAKLREEDDEELEDELEELEDEPEELEDEVEEQEELEDEPEEFEDELDLESILRELEEELEDEVEEQEELEDEPEEFEDEVEETFEIDESLFEEDDEEDDEEEVEPVESEELDKTKAELDEYKEAVKFLKDKLHEVNILNAKLLFTNKLFKEFVLNRDQKLRVVETFDRAQTTREIKLVYSTLVESFKDEPVIHKSKLRESASAKTDSTKPSKESKKVITEEGHVAERFRKLAGLI